MATRSISTSLVADLAALATAGQLHGVIAIHLFGSALVNSDPRDCDLLVVWDDSLITTRDALEFRQVIRSGVVAGVPLDITLLTQAEMASAGFPEHGGTLKLYDASVHLDPPTS